MQNTHRPTSINLSNQVPHSGGWLTWEHDPAIPAAPSPLMLSDRLLTLAKDAEKAGCVGVAGRLLALAHVVLDPQEAGLFTTLG